MIYNTTKMKLLKTQRELGEYNFRKQGHSKIAFTIVAPDEKTGGLIIETGPQGARQKFLIPKEHNIALFEIIDESEEVVPASVLHVEWLKDDSNNEGEFEVFLDEEQSPKKIVEQPQA